MMRTWLRRARRARGDDSGFTLPELIVSIVVLSFIMGAIGLTMVVVLKNTRSSTERVTAGGSAQTLSLWFPGDVQSARGRGAYTGAGATGCGDDQGSTNVVTVQASDVLRNPGDLVSYRLKQIGPGDYELWRVACTAGAWSKRVAVQGIADPATVRVTAVVETPNAANPANPIRTPVTSLVPADVFVQLGLEAAVGAGDAIPLAVSGSPRSPGLEVPCRLVSASPQTVQRVNGGRLTEPAAFMVNTAGDCADLSLTVAPVISSGGTITVAMVGGPTTWTGTAPDVQWSIGLRDVAVTSGGDGVGTFPLDVLPEPCEVTGLEPTDLLRIGITGLATNAVSYVLTTTTSCNVDRVRIDMNTDGDVLPLFAPADGPGRFRFTVPQGSGPWIEDNTRTIHVLDGAQELGTWNLRTSISNCSVRGTTRVVLVDASGVLRTSQVWLDVDAGFTRCTGPLEATGRTPSDLAVTLDTNPPRLTPGQWSQEIAGFPFTWTPRTTVTVDVTEAGDPAGLPFTIAVDDCIVTTTAVTVDTKDGQPDEPLRFTTDNRCSFDPYVKFTDADGDEWLRQAEDDGGGSGSQRNWKVDLPGGVEWTNQTFTIKVYDDELAPFGVDVLASRENGLAGQFLATGVPD